MPELKLKLETEILPKCPHCDEEVQEISYSKLGGAILGKTYVYFCSFCHKTLGIGHRKGFWMG